MGNWPSSFHSSLAYPHNTECWGRELEPSINFKVIGLMQRGLEPQVGTTPTTTREVGAQLIQPSCLIAITFVSKSKEKEILMCYVIRSRDDTKVGLTDAVAQLVEHRLPM